MMSLLVGSACTILLGAGAFYLLDYMKKAPMGTTINTIKEAIQQPAASSNVGEPEPPPRDLASIRIPGTQNNGRRGAGTAVADGVPFAP